MHAPTERGCSCGRPDCPSPAKHPRIAWEWLQGDAVDEDQLRTWWTRWPDANVGVVTGAWSGVVVLDVDPRNGGDGSLAELERVGGAAPVTPESSTGGGGRHLWFRHPGRPVRSAPLAAGLDVKGDGGVAIAPPSRHASGRRYEWIEGRSPADVELAALPAWAVPQRPRRPAAGTPAPVRTTTEQIDFADLWAEAGIELSDGDRYYSCVFHDDDHPSLHVDADGCQWYCFGCARGGGIGALRRELGREAAEAASPEPSLEHLTLEPRVTVEVVGESAHQDELLALTGGRRRWSGVRWREVAHLVPEPTNPTDPAAVAVHIRGRTVGHLDRRAARALRPAIDEAIADHGLAACEAEIRGGWERGHGDVGAFGVTVRCPEVR